MIDAAASIKHYILLSSVNRVPESGYCLTWWNGRFGKEVVRGMDSGQRKLSKRFEVEE